MPIETGSEEVATSASNSKTDVQDVQDLKEVDRIKREKALVEKELMQTKLEIERLSKKETSDRPVDGMDIHELKKQLENAKKEAEENKRRLAERESLIKLEKFINSSDDKYTFIKADDAHEFVVKEMNRHFKETGESITVEEAANVVENQLKEINRKRINRLKGSKEFKELLGGEEKEVKKEESKPEFKNSVRPAVSQKPPETQDKKMSRDDWIRYVIEKSKRR